MSRDAHLPRLRDRAIAAAPFAHEGGEYSCEGCYLAARGAPPAAEELSLQAGFAEALAAALDARERETGLHSKRVACHTLVLARRFSADAGELRPVYWGALLHDLGKIGIPDAVLLKEGPHTPQEWQVMRGHPEIGQRILAGSAIPLWSRLFAVIDTLDAMTSDRPYRKAMTFEAEPGAAPMELTFLGATGTVSGSKYLALVVIPAIYAVVKGCAIASRST